LHPPPFGRSLWHRGVGIVRRAKAPARTLVICAAKGSFPNMGIVQWLPEN